MKALSTDVRDGVLTITLDTPACPVNIFTHAAAAELSSILESIDASTRALVFRSGKPHSFVNGASLMLASAVSKPEDLPRLTSPIRRAYQALGDLGIPTVAAVRGSCYGCGVELTLRCKYRVAGDSYDAHFYMTEIADYLLVPTFGSTQILPHLLGLESATDFLLWGERWSAREALARGLISACLPDDEFDSAVERIGSDLAKNGTSPLLRTVPARSPVQVEDVGNRTRARIGLLPPAYREVYETCYSLMEQAARKPMPDAAGFAAEMLESGRSIMAPISKASVAFFFVRQLSEQVSTRGSEQRSTFHVSCDASTEAMRFLRRQLASRTIRGLTFAERADAQTAPVTCSIVPYPSTTKQTNSIAFTDVLHVEAPEPTSGVVLYAPAWARGLPFVEIASPEPSEMGGTASRLLIKAGIPSVVTHPRTGFLTNDLLRAFLAPQVSFLGQGGSPSDLAATLLDFGFTRLPGDWLAGWDLEPLARVVAPRRGSTASEAQVVEALRRLPGAREARHGSPSPALEAALLVSLLAFARRALDEAAAKHPSILDVAARELIDFPIAKTSLCRHLTPERASELTRHESEMASLVGARDLDSLREYRERGRSFYR